ncbi:hypothetical protein BC938DRAFT_472697 [Jimgerdemannia flammicorona]|uniref:Uncharacterized protein n=1 Tax=Jimgerdemannia flammicorona TaxID=994334 RepID=A0A433Q5L0_9FUNG|nr:hypothetical protein BC938DRAFT_472697 [Jimgerdemannia flammicorona]
MQLNGRVTGSAAHANKRNSEGSTLHSPPPSLQRSTERLLVTTAIAVTPNVGGRLIGMSTRPRPKGLISNFHVSHVTIGYQGGPIMTGAVNVYQIFYGDWSKKAAARKLLSYFINNLSSSRWFDITREYFELDDLNRTHYVTGPIRTAKYFYDNYSHGKSLSHIAIRNIVRGAIKRKYLPTDYNGIYVVYPSEDVTSQDFCETYVCHSFDDSIRFTTNPGNRSNCITPLPIF